MEWVEKILHFPYGPSKKENQKFLKFFVPLSHFLPLSGSIRLYLLFSISLQGVNHEAMEILISYLAILVRCLLLSRTPCIPIGPFGEILFGALVIVNACMGSRDLTCIYFKMNFPICSNSI